MRMADKKWKCISAMPSQFGDKDSWQGRTLPNVPQDDRERQSYLLDIVKKRNIAVAEQYRERLIALYGPERGKKIQYAEAFELNQYGRQASLDELKQMFPASSNRHTVRKAILLSVILAMAGMAPPRGFVAAGQAPQQPAPRFRSGVDVVEVAVLARDRDGKPITDLTRDEITVLENGTPQALVAFEKVSLPVRRDVAPQPRGAGPAGCRQQRAGRPVTRVRPRARQPSRQRDSRPDGQGPRPAVRRELRRPGRLRRGVLARRAAGGDAGFHHRQGAAARRDRPVHRHEDDVGGRRSWIARSRRPRACAARSRCTPARIPATASAPIERWR